MSRNAGHSDPQTVVVIGNGMVGHRFIEQLIEADVEKRFRIVTFCEEPRAAYDRVGLTNFFAHRDAEKLMLANLAWYRSQGVELHIGDRAAHLDRKRRIVRSERGTSIAYDHAVLATGSYPFVPPVPGVKKLGVFLYRTIEDLQQIIAYGRKSKRAAVIGGGLLGLEAAKAVYDLGLETTVLERSEHLLARQVDPVGGALLQKKIEAMGVRVLTRRNTAEVLGNGAVTGLAFDDGQVLDTDMIVVSAGIRPRDELARESGLQVHERGGVVVDDRLRTDDPNVFAIGEVASHDGMTYGLVGPGYEMAEVVAKNLTGGDRKFAGGDLSTKLKLLGVDVASFGDYFADRDEASDARAITFEDPIDGVYKKLVVDAAGKRLLGGILVGDAEDYGTLLMLSKGDADLPVAPGALLVGEGGAAAAGSIDDMSDSAQVCSCNNVTKGQVCAAIREKGLESVADVKACTKAGTGCGGCMPLVTDLFKAEMAAAGKVVTHHLCEHFAFSRQELYEIVKIKKIKTFDALLAECGQGHGCEICRPTAASIFASLWNEFIVEHSVNQDTNDRFLANIQRGGLYSVVPRVPGGEILPDQLIALGEVAKRFNLYSKITGGQRVDLFGARLQDLPEIWERLIAVGFESGHAYAKGMRTVKSCVGSTWCRFGVGDSVGFAIRVEHRYKGLRSPHKLKSAVSGCVRECAEAQSKDFGIIATENGWNLYVCGNGGANPRHADLLAADLDEDTCVRYIDRFLMYYIQTADKLTRTSVWLDKLEGGIDYLRDVVVNDRLGIAEELEKQMQFLVDTYACEWKKVVEDPAKRKLFDQFVNTDEDEPAIEFVDERGQHRPRDWPNRVVPVSQVGLSAKRRPEKPVALEWVNVGAVDDFPADGGRAVKHGRSQIAVYRFASLGAWYASQNMCPHQRDLVLSRGLLGDANGEPKVACPQHKKTFSLKTGACLSGEDYSVDVFKVKIEGGEVWVQLPPAEVLDARLGSSSCHEPCAVPS